MGRLENNMASQGRKGKSVPKEEVQHFGIQKGREEVVPIDSSLPRSVCIRDMTRQTIQRPHIGVPKLQLPRNTRTPNNSTHLKSPLPGQHALKSTRVVVLCALQLIAVRRDSWSVGKGKEV